MEAEETKQIIDKFLNSNEESNNYFNNKSSYHYFDANYPDCILVKVEKGGSSGGNCWNDDPSEPYEKETYEIEQDISSEVKYRIYQLAEDLNINLKSDKNRSLFSSSFRGDEVHEESQNEYYGNYRTEAIYAIKIKDVLENLLTKEEFDILEKSLHELILEKKPELLEENKKTSKKFK